MSCGSVGLVVDYRRDDSTLAALQLAAHLRNTAEVSILSTVASPAALDRDLDKLVVRAADVRFTDWIDLRRPRMLVWVAAPPAAQLRWATQAGIRTVLLGACREPEARRRESYPLFDVIVAPTRATVDLLEGQHRLTNVRHVAWSPMAPITRKGALAGPPRLYFPLSVGVTPQDAVQAITVAWRLLRDHDCDVVLAHAGWPGVARRSLDRLAREFRPWPDRFRVVKAGDQGTELARLGAASLTCLVPRYAPFGAVATTSLHMGTPVVAFDVPPVREFLRDGVNAALVPIDLGGRTPAREAYDTYESAVAGLVDDADAIADLCQGTGRDLRRRREAFEAAWADIAAKAWYIAPGRS